MATQTGELKKRRKKKVIFRKSNDMNDLHLQENSHVWHRLLLDRQAQFSAFDSDFSLPYATEWESKITAFEKFPTDETMHDDIEERLRVFHVELKTLMRLVADLEYYVKKAFPDDDRTYHEFGFVPTRAAAANRNAGKSALLCLTMTKVAADFNTQLTGAAMPAGLVTSINNQKDTMADAWSEVEYGRRLSYRATTQRIKMFNELWTIHCKVRDAAAIIFRDDELVAKMFE